MKAALIAVVSELYTFAVFEWAGIWKRLKWPAPALAESIPVVVVQESPPRAAEFVYAAERELALRADPAHAFDNVLARIPYGTALISYATHESGAWISVKYNEVRGWVMREKIVALPRALIPSFEASARYDGYHTETLKLRNIINDEFGCGALTLPLTDAEYAVYRLGQKRKTIPWGNARPRIPGTWHALLAGDPRIRTEVLPSADSIMEYAIDGRGHVAFVEAVFPGFAIHVSEVGEPEEGMYTERTLTREEWREYRPVFISATMSGP